MSKKSYAFSVALVVPALVMLTVTIIIPLAQVIRMSFSNYSMLNLNNVTFSGLSNYRKLLSEPEFFRSFGRTLQFVAITVSVQFVLGMLVALLLNHDFRGRNFFRGLIFLPWTLPTIIVAVIFMWIMQPQYGVLNYVLRSASVISANVNWLGNTQTALGSVIAAAVWRQLPFMMVMLLAGLQTVSKDLLEASQIDGANAVQVFWHITIPCIKSVIKTVILTAIIGNFQMFTLFYNMTAGGPVRATTTLAVYTYETAFMSYDLGKGSAVGVIWMLFLLVFGVLYNKLLSRNELYEG